MDVRVGLWRKLSTEERIDTFELCWKRLLRIPWTARISNQSILKESWVFIGRTDAEAESPILGHLMGRVDSLEKMGPDAGRD